MRFRTARRTLGQHPRVFFGGLVCLLAVAWQLTGCGGDYCNGEDCDCSGREECIISCERGGCDLECSDTGQECGAICGDDCAFDCSSTVHCSSFSGDNSVVDCHSLTSCAAECGANCQYTAESVSSLHLKVGPNSEVWCNNLSECDVDCNGPCTVNLNSIGGHHVTCDGVQTDPIENNSKVVCD